VDALKAAIQFTHQAIVECIVNKCAGVVGCSDVVKEACLSGNDAICVFVFEHFHLLVVESQDRLLHCCCSSPTEMVNSVNYLIRFGHNVNSASEVSWHFVFCHRICNELPFLRMECPHCIWRQRTAVCKLSLLLSTQGPLSTLKIR
jgi:hypothetical protein